MSPGAEAPTLLVGVAVSFLAWAVLSLRPGSSLRRLYGVDPSDERGVRANAAVVGGCGVGFLLLAGALSTDVPPRVVGTATVLAAGLLCVVLGLLVRYRDVRALLTTPDVDRARARRLGGAVVFCGLLTVPLAAALWFRAETAVVVTLALGTSVVSLLAVGVAYR